MTRPLVDAEAATRVGQAPRFVRARALAESTGQAALWGGVFGWGLGLLTLVSSSDFDRNDVLSFVIAQLVLFGVLSLLSVLMARRGASMPAAPLPVGVVLVPAAETRRSMLRAWLGGLLVGIVLLAVLSAGSNPNLLGMWGAAVMSIGLGQRTRARAYAAREQELDRTLWLPERRAADVPRLAAGPREPEIERSEPR